MPRPYYYNVRLSGGSGGGGAWPGTLRRVDLDFRDASDRIWKCKGHTGFRLTELAFKGEWGWIDDYLGSWAAMGANCNREFNIWDNTGFNAYKDRAYDAIERLWTHTRDTYGYYHHTVYFCNQRDGGPNKLSQAEQNEHVRLLSEAAIRVGNVFGEIENESTDPDNTGDASLITRFDADDFLGVLMTRTTWPTAAHDDPDPTYGKPWLDWATYHPSRDVPEWPWESAKIAMEAQKGGLGPWPPAFRPSMPGETIRIGGGTMPRQWADCVFHCLNFGLGLIVHGGYASFDPNHDTDLQNCVFPNPGQPGYDSIQAIRDVWTSPLIVPNAAADGEYRRAAVRNPDSDPVYGDVPGVGHVRIFPQTDDECPIVHWDKYIDVEDAHYEDPRGAGRNYWMKLPDGLMVGGPIDIGDQWTLEPRLGYRVVAQGGYTGDGKGGNILHMRP